ncbi:MAG: glycoside hydrolase family 127 protein [Phycisphaerae bacterium]|nr:glycoside hydrolase family 127 protein [Phycisphaerae bacterium]
MKASPLLPMMILCVTSTILRAAAEQKVSLVPTPPMDGTNAHYVSNRAPLLPNPLVKLPIGAITPKGWLRGQLELERDGFIGHLTEISKWCDPKRSAWISPKGEGDFGWEELPYWLKGYGDLGYVLADEHIIAEARKWIEGVLSSQDSDGWFGPRANKKGKDCWPNMIMLNVLQSYYEFSGDQRVLPFMAKYFKWQMSIPRKDLIPGSWQAVRAGDNLESVYWLYNRTGEPWLLDLGHVIHSKAIPWALGVANWHGVNLCQGFREPGVYYVQTKNRRHLDAAERNYQTVITLYGQAPGGMFGADENCRPGYNGPRQAAETCSMVEFMHSFQMLMTFTGDPMWADRCEQVAFNSLPASMPPDLKGLHYLTAPNMIKLDRKNKSPGLQNGGCMLAYDPHLYRCCQHNVAMGWPYYAEHLWMATRDNGLAAALYAASGVKAKVADGAEVTISETTDYPFDEKVTLAVTIAKPTRFPLYLRVPRWCAKAAVSVSGKPVSVDAKPLTYIKLDRTWSDGDKVELTLPMTLHTKVWRSNCDSMSVHHGPLAYSLRIGENWVRWGEDEKWPGYDVLPTTPWNYGLVVDDADPAKSFQIIRKTGDLGKQPFTPDDAPVTIKAKGKRIPQWQIDHLGLVGPLQASPARSDQPVEDITLIPMGCARLRISAFPVIGDGPNAFEWTPPPPIKHEASHVNDVIDAVSDGVVPKNSNDQGIPRFTWWPHRGTTEWITYRFDKPRKVSSCEVYWFDDTGVGHCRVPESWKLFYRLGQDWRPVAKASEFATKPDQFNKVTFTPVETTELKIEVKLKRNYSSGILEWRAGA